jgi:hypothetical protein
MFRYLISFSLLYSNVLMASEAQLHLIVNDKEGHSFLQERNSYNLSGELSNSTMGFCRTKGSGACEKTFNMSEAFSENLARANAAFTIPEDLKSIYVFPPYKIHTKTLSLNPQGLGSEYKVISHMEMGNTLYPLEERILKIEAIPLKVAFSSSQVSESRRFDYLDVNENHKKLSTAVFQIIGDVETSGLGGSASSSGTGFFISSSGYALTNLHVLEAKKTCLEKKSCTIEIKQKDSESRSYQVQARVLTCSSINDFCLIKLSIPSNLLITHLETSFNSISDNLMTLGYPADRSKTYIDAEGEESNEYALTYSYGSPVGFSKTGISSTIYIFNGASGSPVIDLNSNKVVGLNSNGAASMYPGADGMPCIFRTLFIIERDFSLSHYLSGEKQSRIERLIKKISSTSDASQVASVLEQINQEKSFYGRSKLEVLSYNHSSREVRKILVKYLKDMRLTKF